MCEVHSLPRRVFTYLGLGILEVWIGVRVRDIMAGVAGAAGQELYV